MPNLVSNVLSRCLLTLPKITVTKFLMSQCLSFQMNTLSAGDARFGSFFWYRLRDLPAG
jgi:hypothetical protein